MDTTPFHITTGEVCPQLREVMEVPNASWFPDNGAPRHLIVASLPDITQKEVAEFMGPLRFDLCVYHGLLVLLMTTADGAALFVMLWAPVVGLDYIEPDATEGHRLVPLVVMDHTTGVVVAQRAFTWAPHFDRQMENQIARLQRTPITLAEVEERVSQMWRDYPDGYQLRERSIAYCGAGS